MTDDNIYNFTIMSKGNRLILFIFKGGFGSHYHFYTKAEIDMIQFIMEEFDPLCYFDIPTGREFINLTSRQRAIRHEKAIREIIKDTEWH